LFGYVSASYKELTPQQKLRYNSIYCGICRRIHAQSGSVARLGLSYDIAFLSALLMSLYEPEETSGANSCLPHPITKKPWVDSAYIRYGSDMNVALSYYQLLDDWQDDRKLTAKLLSGAMETPAGEIALRYPRQCRAIEDCIRRLSRLEQEGCDNPDLCAGCFGDLMGELFVYEEDLWSPTLRQMGNALGRFIYLLDAAVDYDKDEKKGSYNPFLAMGTGKDWPRWEQYLVMTMGRCTEYFEKLPLVQDKDLLDNILYSGVWTGYRRTRQKEDHHD
jgi:hypothetical protein